MAGKLQVMMFLSGSLHVGEEQKGYTIKKECRIRGEKKNAKHPLKYLFGANQHSVDSTEEPLWVNKYSLVVAGSLLKVKLLTERNYGFSGLKTGDNMFCLEKKKKVNI